MKFALVLLFFLCPSILYSVDKWGIVSVPVADVRTVSGSLPTSHDFDPDQETQLLYGEIIKIVDGNVDWLKIEAVEQPEYSHNNRWEGYPGWVRGEFVLQIKKVPEQNFVVHKKIARLFSSPDFQTSYIPLSLGTKILCPGIQKKGFWKIKTVDGKTGWISINEIRFLTPIFPEEFLRKLIIDSALELLGDLYFWGGRSAHISELQDQVTSVDCSGLVNLAYRVAGIDIPRDSYEQFLKAKKIEKEKLKMGDLIFSGPKEQPNRISHVAIFIDDKTLIEAPKTGERVRKISFEEKYGVPFEQILDGQPIGDRLIHFGTYF